jgi:hypothetical protein
MCKRRGGARLVATPRMIRCRREAGHHHSPPDHRRLDCTSVYRLAVRHGLSDRSVSSPVRCMNTTLATTSQRQLDGRNSVVRLPPSWWCQPTPNELSPLRPLYSTVRPRSRRVLDDVQPAISLSRSSLLSSFRVGGVMMLSERLLELADNTGCEQSHLYRIDNLTISRYVNRKSSLTPHHVFLKELFFRVIPEYREDNRVQNREDIGALLGLTSE